jgi:uncharacterized protein
VTPAVLRTIPGYFDPQAVAEIDRRLDAVAEDHDVSIIWAIESGSRAWGFPSPDSDYDGRFIYVRHMDRYLSPWQPRDVIEMPIEGDMDVNGWDLGKAIQLMLKGNAVVLEWLQSPIIYCGDPQFRMEMLELASQCANRANSMRHYYHLGTQQWDRFRAFADEAPAKKLFYAARPALCIRWLRIHEGRNVPPMNFQILLAESDPPIAIRESFEQLVEAKAKTRELGFAVVSDDVREFIDTEYRLAQSYLPDGGQTTLPEHIEMGAKLFRETVSRYSAG